MERLRYGTGRLVPEPYDEVVPKVKTALGDEGLGVMTEIDVQAALRARLGVEVGKYTILGACAPENAHKALEAEPDLGLLLPCNVVVYEVDEGTRVSVIDAQAMLGIVGNPLLDDIAADVQARLDRVLAAA